MSCPYLANYIVKFKKDASTEDIEKFYSDLTSQGRSLPVSWYMSIRC